MTGPNCPFKKRHFFYLRLDYLGKKPIGKLFIAMCWAPSDQNPKYRRSVYHNSSYTDTGV